MVPNVPAPSPRRGAGDAPRAHPARLAVLVAVAVASACGGVRSTPPPRPLTPQEESRVEWPRELALAQAAATRREFGLADSVLRAFAARFPGTIESSDAMFWRALLRLDPAAPRDPERDPVRDAAAALDAYIAGGPVQPRYVEATTLRRLAGLLDSLRAAAGAPRGALPSATLLRDSLKVRDDSIARLQKELDQTSAELERIRKRLAPKRP